MKSLPYTPAWLRRLELDRAQANVMLKEPSK